MAASDCFMTRTNTHKSTAFPGLEVYRTRNSNGYASITVSFYEGATSTQITFAESKCKIMARELIELLEAAIKDSCLLPVAGNDEGK
jgi:hypothetical protein